MSQSFATSRSSRFNNISTCSCFISFHKTMSSFLSCFIAFAYHVRFIKSLLVYFRRVGISSLVDSFKPI